MCTCIDTCEFYRIIIIDYFYVNVAIYYSRDHSILRKAKNRSLREENHRIFRARIQEIQKNNFESDIFIPFDTTGAAAIVNIPVIDLSKNENNKRKRKENDLPSIHKYAINFTERERIERKLKKLKIEESYHLDEARKTGKEIDEYDKKLFFLIDHRQKEKNIKKLKIDVSSSQQKDKGDDNDHIIGANMFVNFINNCFEENARREQNKKL